MRERFVFDCLKKAILSKLDVTELRSECEKDFFDFHVRLLSKYSHIKANNADTVRFFDIERYPFRLELPFDDPNLFISQLNAEYRLNHSDKISIIELRLFVCSIYAYVWFIRQRQSEKLKSLRQSQVNLPIYSFKEQILSKLQCHNVILIAGNTGCGKSTQVPQYLLGAGYTSIACTQPRRIACISLAKRVSYETCDLYKNQIAYHVRFDTNIDEKSTKVTFLTEGLLLRQIQNDPELSKYKVIIMDEIHERSTNTDILMGILKNLISKRSDIKVVLMSATVNISLFTNYFSNNVPVIEVPGRLHRIDLKYCPQFTQRLSDGDHYKKSSKFDPQPYVKLMRHIDEQFPKEERGDLLIFVSGVKEINSVIDAARQYASMNNNWIILPLHSGLTVEEQDRVFDYTPLGVRKAVVSTNIAETSVTIDGIRFVIDSGKMKEMNYDTAYLMNRLQEFWISQASAEQRKGRAGRTGPGVCYRLYSNDDYEAMEKYSKPEIQRTALYNVILQLTTLGYVDTNRFDFIEPPPHAAILEAHHLLINKNALTIDGQITQLGVFLASLPLAPSIGIILLGGCLLDCIGPCLLIAATSTVGTPFRSRLNGSYFDPENSYNLNKYFNHAKGDGFVYLHVFTEWLKLKRSNYTRMRNWCFGNGIVERRLFEIVQLCDQFEKIIAANFHLSSLKLSNANRQATSNNSRDTTVLSRYQKNQLKSLKKQLINEEPRQRRLLSAENDDPQKVESPAVSSWENIKEIEFKLLDSGKSLSHFHYDDLTESDIHLIKFAICSGLYPHVSIADEVNRFRLGPEAYFHLKEKQFVTIHPTSCYSYKPLILKNLTSTDIKSPFVIFYGSLLETTKQYLVDCYHVPALHMLLLVGLSIDTNSNFSRIVIDDWLEFGFISTKKAIDFVIEAVKLRTDIEYIKHQFLQNQNAFEFRLADFDVENYLKQKSDIVSRLKAYFDTSIEYSMKYILMGDRKNLFHGPKFFDPSNLPQININIQNKLSTAITSDTSDLQRENHFKGGFYVTDYLVFNSLKPTNSHKDGDHIKKHFYCEKCNDHLVCNDTEKANHIKYCKPPTQTINEPIRVGGPNQKTSFCDKCQRTISGTTLDLLRHKKLHDPY